MRPVVRVIAPPVGMPDPNWKRLRPSQSAPLDRAESGTSEEDLHQADRFDCLVPEFYSRVMGVPVRN